MNGPLQYKYYGKLNINGNVTFIQQVIQNIEQNFAFLAITENMDLSTEIAKVVLHYKKVDQVNLRIKRSQIQHTTKGKRPAAFPKRILDQLYEKTRADMLIYNYFVRKMEITREHFLSF